MAKHHGVSITWCGHSCFRIESQGRRLYVDPFLSHNPTCPPSEKEPKKADAALLTHAHFDHVADVAAVARTGAKVVCIYELASILGKNGINPEQFIGMGKGGTAEIAGAEVTMVDAHHSSGFQSGDQILYAGEPAGYVIALGALRLYHAGDTCIFGDMALISELYRPEIAMLPIGGFYTMGPREAAHAARLLKVRAVIPMHFGTFPPLKGTPDELERELKGAAEVMRPTPGETFTV
jgi:L-ascorbate metabolism protein UlaG (beta-lactamase superfamily)